MTVCLWLLPEKFSANGERLVLVHHVCICIYLCFYLSVIVTGSMSNWKALSLAGVLDRLNDNRNRTKLKNLIFHIVRFLQNLWLNKQWVLSKVCGVVSFTVLPKCDIPWGSFFVLSSVVLCEILHHVVTRWLLTTLQLHTWCTTGLYYKVISCQ